ncbi:MAG: PTS sugar transporter subunit IIA [Phycisphaerales bacterium]|jgi:mannitol/fructose-specific phosphotransferase system IIA component (Ntr-type)|nr:PTS fructose transporter subunit IIA [Planctomycetaceae bacterium]MDP7519405.1 PTS sugar transporter subunit IIA [Phycisphaerales bacterium]|tara:strand:- start:2374 stop:2853 length:480 start_codon:yes stop_codon:yes gene_type:complete
MMKLTEIVVQKAISPTLGVRTRDEVIGALMDLLVEAGEVSTDDRDDFVKAVIKRDNRGSTGFGNGVAVPHLKQASVKKVVVAIANVGDGIDFNALDGNPVHSIFLLLSPEDQPELHLEAMEAVFGSLSQETFRRFLRQATTVKEIVTLLKDADSRQLST